VVFHHRGRRHGDASGDWASRPGAGARRPRHGRRSPAGRRGSTSCRAWSPGLIGSSWPNPVHGDLADRPELDRWKALDKDASSPMVLTCRASSRLPSSWPTGPYTQVFSALGAESALNCVRPNAAVRARAPGQRARQHRHEMGVAECSRGREIEGSGFVIFPRSTSSPTRTSWTGSGTDHTVSTPAAASSTPRWCDTTRRCMRGDLTGPGLASRPLPWRRDGYGRTSHRGRHTPLRKSSQRSRPGSK